MAETTRKRSESGTRKTTQRPRKGSEDGPRAESDPRPKARGGMRLAADAARQLQQLTGHEVEGITGLHRGDDGWTVLVDVLELRRVPSTTDVLATYEVEVDGDGELMGYRRRRRYVRGEVGDD